MGEVIASLFSIVSFSYCRNCLFRALADQIDGDHNRHTQFRRSTVQFMRQNVADFQPFHDGETTFDKYCKNLAHGIHFYQILCYLQLHTC